MIGNDPAKPDLVVATNGGSDLIYLPNKDKKLAGRTVKALLEQDYVSGIFVDDDLGRLPGTLPMSQLFLRGKAVTPQPAIVVNFRSYASGCEQPTNCSVEVADTVLRQGQGMHGSFSRGDTLNFMAAIGPDFKAGYVDALPVSNADVGATAARLLDLTPRPRGHLVGRVMTEAMPHGTIPRAFSGTVKSKPAANGLRTVLKFQRVQSQRYFDAAGFPGPDARARCHRTASRKRRGNSPAAPLRSWECAMLADRLHPDVEHVRQVRQRQRGDPDEGRDQGHQGAVAAGLAAHLARDPFQHFDVDHPVSRRPALDRGVR